MVAAIRCVADWLADATEGVNAHLARVPRDGDDPAPPPIATIADTTRTGWAARGLLPRGEPAALPLVVVSLAPDPATLDPSIKTTSRGARVAHGTVAIAVQLVVRHPESQRAACDVAYGLRALRGALLALASAPGSARTRGGLQLVQLQRLETAHYEERDDLGASGVVVATWSTRETV